MAEGLSQSASLLEEAGPAFLLPQASLRGLTERLAEGRFHLAVLGQFKRGKSTLLNALLGADILPTAVVPLTAIPTQIRWGEEPGAVVRFSREKEALFSAKDGVPLKAFLTRYVSESANPENALAVTSVEIAYPSPLLERGIVLIDTPGIGSTFRHNTETTLDFLAQCDAALFVLSADPPPTEAELAFLDQVRTQVPRLFFVLNKVDYLDPDEAGEVEAFLRNLLTEKVGLPRETLVFPLSAKKALQARERGDASLWESSGLEALRRHLVDFSVAEKERALIQALSGRGADIVAEALLSLRLEFRSLAMPLEDLQRRLNVFDEKIALLERQRRRVTALLDVEKKEVQAFLEELARSIRERARVELERKLADASLAQSDIDAALPGYFEKLFAEATEAVSARTGEALSFHQASADELIEAVRKTAAELFDIPYHAPSGDEAFATVRRPYWVTETASTLNPLDGVFGFRRGDSRSERIDKLLLSNVENLRWSLLQSVNEAFRRFAARLEQRLAATTKATHGAVKAALDRRREAREIFDEKTRHLGKLIEELEGIYEEFLSLAGHRNAPANDRR
ncbi:dynamin family protein [Aminirod propionatiphilus]|uniref:Dynamin family protein n=1 Tax=Aminirod propionatiphilus TaxID=3415223 RepID=A0ACD1DVK4_9BACT|nr:dynamin family protein [Synergistota bacterium]